MALSEEIQSELLIAQLLEEELECWSSAMEAERLQLDAILTASEPEYAKTDCAISEPPPPLEAYDSNFALAIFTSDARLTSDTAYVESLQITEESEFVTNQQFAQRVAAKEKKLALDMEFARKLQDAVNSGLAAGNVGDAESILGLDAIDTIMASDLNNKGKGKICQLPNEVNDKPVLATRIDESKTAPPYVVCGICMEPCQETFSPISASLSANSSKRLPFGLRLSCPEQHAYCIDCLASYIGHKLESDGGSGKTTDTTVFPIRCPECSIDEWEEGIQAEVAQKVLTEDTMLLWYHRKLLDSLPRYYCPNPRCSTRLELHDAPDEPQAVCPYCEMLICVPCQVEWHQNLTCEAFQELPSDERSPEDQLVLQLAKAQNWRRCPTCKQIVELTVGCNHITCLCGTHFCFRCGSRWAKGRCTREPACELWDEEMLLEVREREREGQPRLQPAPAAPFRLPPLPRAAIVRHENLMWITDANIVHNPGYHTFTTRMIQHLTCGYCHVRLNSVADLRYHLVHVRRHAVYACCGRFFEDAPAYEQHQIAAGDAPHLYQMARTRG